MNVELTLILCLLPLIVVAGDPALDQFETTHWEQKAIDETVHVVSLDSLQATNRLVCTSNVAHSRVPRYVETEYSGMEQFGYYHQLSTENGTGTCFVKNHSTRTELRWYGHTVFQW